jgi:uncharacterized membrane protein (Fun14 family)
MPMMGHDAHSDSANNGGLLTETKGFSRRRSVLMLILELGIWVLPLTLLQPLDVYGLEWEAYMVY